MSQQLDGLLGMLCVDVAPADGASIQQTLKLLEEKLKSVGKQSISSFKIHTWKKKPQLVILPALQRQTTEKKISSDS